MPWASLRSFPLSWQYQLLLRRLRALLSLVQGQSGLDAMEPVDRAEVEALAGSTPLTHVKELLDEAIRRRAGEIE